MREILFRGKRVDNGEWVYGNFIADALSTKNYPVDWGFIKYYSHEESKSYTHEVELQTVGQYTGMTDRNGNKIFEGDIIKCRGGEYCYGVWEYCSEIIISNLTQIGFELGEYEHIEIIGNIHDGGEDDEL